MRITVARAFAKAGAAVLETLSGTPRAGRAVGAAIAVNGGSSAHIIKAALSTGSTSQASAAWFLPAAAAAFASSQIAQCAEVEQTFIMIKPDGFQRGLIAEIIGRFERKGYKLVGIKVVIPTKDFAEKHYYDLKGRPFFNGLTDFLSSGPVVAMVWEGPGVIDYGRKLIGKTSPQASEPGSIRGDLAVVVGRNIIHGSDGPDTAKEEIQLWFKPEEVVDFPLDAHKWVYE